MMEEAPVAPAPPPPGRAAAAGSDLVYPVALVVIAFFLWMGFQMFYLIKERTTLHALQAGQEHTVQEATKVRAQFESVTRKTADLAAQGNAGAKTIVDELRKRGINISPPPSPSPTLPEKKQ